MKTVFAFAIAGVLSTSLFAADGAATFKTKCAGCHGPDGTKVIAALGVKPLNTPEVKKMGTAGVDNIVTKGQGKMPAFAGKLSPEEISAVSAYVLTLK
jgi:mono/diheme cytochrome c family protein